MIYGLAHLLMNRYCRRFVIVSVILHVDHDTLSSRKATQEDNIGNCGQLQILEDELAHCKSILY